MNNRPNPFNMFGQSAQSQSINQTPNYPSNQGNYQMGPQNYPPMNYGTGGSNNNMSGNGYGGSGDMAHNSFINHHSANYKKHEQQIQNPVQQFGTYDTSINIESLSPKQLLCECIDLATAMLKQVVDAYSTNNELKCPYQGKKVIDFSFLANYILDPARLQTILSQFLAQDDQSVKALVKSWVFELKYIRNLWAHSEKINYRLAFRGYDTLGLLFDSFGGDQNSDLYRKIETYRKALLITQAKSGVF